MNGFVGPSLQNSHCGLAARARDGLWPGIIVAVALCCVPDALADTAKWTVHEVTLESSREYKKPLWDARIRVKLTSPSGRQDEVEAFWYEGRTWKFRFSPDETGQWQWKTQCSDTANKSLHGQMGSLKCMAYRGENPLYRHGAIRLSKDRMHFQHADGKPFFFLSCTAWNGALKSTTVDWKRYLETRHRQRFTAIQFVSTQWRGGRKTLDEPVYIDDRRVSVSTKAFQRLDARVAAINAHGLVASPVVLWALFNDDPGNALSEENAIRLAQYIVSRWGAYQVIWLLSGDCRFAKQSVARWKRIGKALFGKKDVKPKGAKKPSHVLRSMARLVTLHPSGQNWIGDTFGGEPWLDFHSYQSGHGDGRGSLKWHVDGPVLHQWKKKPYRPVVNLEPNYEAHPAYESKKLHSAQHVRRAAYWSLMIAPPAGVTYGHNAIWVWNEKPGRAERHERLGIVQPWSTGLDAPGAKSMTVLRDYFESGPWTKLRPAQKLLVEQPGSKDPNRFVTAAATKDGRWAVAYLPVGGAVQIRTGGLRMPFRASWVDPASGKRRDAGMIQGPSQKLTAPSSRDWLLDLRAARK